MLQTIFKNIYFYILSAMVVCVAFYSKDFTKISFHGVFVLEIFFVITVLYVLIFDFKRLRKLLKKIIYHKYFIALICAFTLLFVFHLGFDAVRDSSKLLNLRTIQHYLIIIYPIMWITIGYWVAYCYQDQLKKMMIFLFIANGISFFFRVYSNVYENPLDRHAVGTNLALGCLSFSASLILFFKYIYKKKINKTWILFIISLAVFSLIPFWRMMEFKLQRITFIMLFIDIFLISLMYFKSLNFKFISVISIFSILVIGTMGISMLLIPKHKITVSSSKDKLEDVANPAFVLPLMHSDDLQTDQSGKVQLFQSRAKWWNYSINQWKNNIFLGIGFIPEVPNYIDHEVPNDGTFMNERDNKKDSKIKYAPMIGPHNSYLNILVRTGLLGFFILLFVLFLNLKEIFQYVMKIDFNQNIDLIFNVVVVSHFLIFSLVGTGFESPHFSFIGWLFFGILIYRSSFQLAKV